MPSLTSTKAKVSIVIFYLLLIAGLALYDEKAQPELPGETAPPAARVKEPGNAWLAFLGIDAPPGVDPFTRGESKLTEVQQALASAKNPDDAMRGLGGNKQALDIKGKMPGFYGPKDGGILAYASAHPDETARLATDNRELLHRYETLASYPRYTESLEYGFYTPFPKFGTVRNIHRIKLLQLAERANHGDPASALTELRRDLEFWHFIARNSTSLLSRLIAIAALNTGLQFTAELATSHPLTPAELATVQYILRPLQKEELSMAGAIRGEARYIQSGLDIMRTKSSNWDSLIYKPNATRNRMEARVREQIRLAEMDAQTFLREVKNPSRKRIDRKIGLPFLYNPAGEILALESESGQIPKFLERVHNLEGLRRLALLKVTARLDKVPPEQMQQFLESHAKELGDPYTGKAMRWDAKRKRLYFTGAVEEKPVEVAL